MKPSRSFLPNHSWLRSFFVVMGGGLRAGWGAKHSADPVELRCAVLLQTENVYSHSAVTPQKESLDCRALRPGETKRCNDNAKRFGWSQDMEFANVYCVRPHGGRDVAVYARGGCD